MLLISKYYFLLYAFVLAGSVIGAFYMLRLQIAGFHIYVVSKIVAFSMEWFVFETGFSAVSLMVAAIFIYLYFRYLKLMKNAHSDKNISPLLIIFCYLCSL